MNQVKIDKIIAQLAGRRDKHIIAHAYNCRHFGAGQDAIAVGGGLKKKAMFRRLGLIVKRPGHETLSANEAEYILTELGLEVGRQITGRYRLALAKV